MSVSYLQEIFYWGLHSAIRGTYDADSMALLRHGTDPLTRIFRLCPRAYSVGNNSRLVELGAAKFLNVYIRAENYAIFGEKLFGTRNALYRIVQAKSLDVDAV
jgi:hypothetical protein